MRAALALLVLLALLAAGCGGSGDGPSKDGSRDTSTKSTSTSDDGDEPVTTDEDEGEPTKVPEPVPAGQKAPIRIVTPSSLQQLVGSFVLSGEATVNEGALAWAILDAKLRPMVSGRITASCGAPCRGRFRVRIPLRNVPLGSWELHVWAPNAADTGPRRLNDTMVPITVSDQRTPGQPDPTAVPPGGPPQFGE